MKICFDWEAIHGGLIGEGESRVTAARQCAEHIRDEILRGGYKPDQLFGKAPQICARYDLGRETFLEAARLLENWGVARMRRGAHGGLVVANNVETAPVAKLTRYLQMRGLHSAQIREARAVIDLTARYCREREVDREPFFNRHFHKLVARAHPFSGREGARCHAGQEPWDKCLGVFREAIDAVEKSSRRHAHFTHNWAGNGASGESLAVHVVHLLAGEIASLEREDRSQIRSEASITDSLGVSRQVTRQAMRILQDEGLLQCRRGRSGGVNMISDHPAPVLRSLVAHYGEAKLSRAEFSPVLSIIARANRVLCGMRASEKDFSRLAGLAGEQRFDDPVTHIARLKLEWQIVDNPALSLLEQSLATYRAAIAGRKVSTGFGNVQFIADCTNQQVSAMRERNYPLADSLMQNIEGELAAITGTF